MPRIRTYPRRRSLPPDSKWPHDPGSAPVVNRRSAVRALVAGFVAAVLFLLISGHAAWSQGIIVAPDGRPAQVVLDAHRIDAHIDENVAVVSVEHDFRNHGSTFIEGSFLFPLPAGAQISRFSMDVDGQEISGELLDAEKARRVYEDIVRRSLDPALLEMVGHRSFRASVFPIPPGETRTIRLRYDAVLPKDGSLVTFQYPLQGSVQTNPTTRRIPGTDLGEAVSTIQDNKGPSTSRMDSNSDRTTSIRLEIASTTPIANIYSPSHAVASERPAATRAIVRHTTPIEDNRDFILYVDLEDADVGATLLTHRPYSDRPGYFMLLLSPSVDRSDSRAQARDVVFVLDTSGSMAGEKIEQAREALRYCLNRLGDDDRFGLIAFSSDVDRFRPELMPAGSRQDAIYFLDHLEAGGGTNIHEALLEATDLLANSERGTIVFLTDGLPSVGVVDGAQIRRAVQTKRPDGVRLFTFGVGYDVNTLLLDGLSHDSGVPADYISPDENIEERIAAFYDKISHPLLVDLDLQIDGVEAFAFAPTNLLDLHKDGQLMVTGRYRKPGTARVILTGSRHDSRERFSYSFVFPEVERNRDFVARLWATRRVGQLLEQVRLNGENEELKDEIVSLAKEFGLVTPYTSYLVREEESLAMDAPQIRSRGQAVAPISVWGERDFKADEVSGAAAVAASRATKAMSTAEHVIEPARVVSVHGRTMIFDGRWVDAEFTEETPIIDFRIGSDAYFSLLRVYPEALDFARLGSDVSFRLGDVFVRLGESGLESIEESDLKSLIG